jgi:hypothetical protein
VSSAALTAQQVFDAMIDWREVEEKLDVDDHRRMVFKLGPRYEDELVDEDVGLLLRAMHHPRSLYRMVALEYGHRHAEVVSQGLRDTFWRVRRTAAQCAAAPPHLLAQLVHDTSAEVRIVAAEHPQMPLAALHALLEDRVSGVREAAAQHPSLTEADLCRLAEHYLASSHSGRRKIGAEFVKQGVTRPGVPPLSAESPFDSVLDVLVALFTGQQLDRVAAWVKDTDEQKWLRSYVSKQLRHTQAG